MMMTGQGEKPPQVVSTPTAPWIVHLVEHSKLLCFLVVLFHVAFQYSIVQHIRLIPSFASGIETPIVLSNVEDSSMVTPEGSQGDSAAVE